LAGEAQGSRLLQTAAFTSLHRDVIALALGQRAVTTLVD
jgi:hypothetical protein